MYLRIISSLIFSGIIGSYYLHIAMYVFKNSSLKIPFTGTFFFWCTLPICLASYKSLTGSAVSKRIKIRSNLDSKAAGRFKFFWVDYFLLYRPKIGLAAARTAVLEFKVVMMPALVIETVCCSMTSWIAVLSYSSILSNSSMQQIPMSAKTRAPASKESSFVIGSVTIAAVKPTPELPFPVV